jgi:hypothetical protein
VCHEINKVIGRITSALPDRSVLVVYTGNGNLSRLREQREHDAPRRIILEDPVRKEQFSQCRAGLLWVLTKTGD